MQNIPLNNLNLSKIKLSGANLSGADLSNADLSGANLSNANLTNAEVNNTNFYKAILENVKGLKVNTAKSQGAIFCGAKLPNKMQNEDVKDANCKIDKFLGVKSEEKLLKPNT